MSLGPPTCHICGRATEGNWEPHCTCHEEAAALRTRIAELELLNEAYRERISPAISCPIEEFLGPVKPCPFCGSEGINLYEGQVECGNCRATAEPGPWQFRDTRKLEAAESRIRELDQDRATCLAVLANAGNHSPSIHEGIASLVAERHALRARVAGLEAREARLRNDLLAYGQHLESCVMLCLVNTNGWHYAKLRGCSCGFKQALEVKP